nr:m7GpppX diphosphatase [Onthophagus taurus]
MAETGEKTLLKEVVESEDLLCPPSKKQKITDAADDAQESIHTNIKNLADFTIDKVLSNNTKCKSVSLLGSFEGVDGKGLVILEKTAFEDDHLTTNSEYFHKNNSLNKIYHNNIYGNYEYLVNGSLNCLKAIIVHPATDREIQKYSISTFHIVNETGELYKEVVLPIVEKKCDNNLEWVYNILDHKCEADRIIYEDSDPKIGFVLLPDLKWNGTTLDNLYLIAIVKVRGLKSLRDLTEEHLPLLRNVMTNGSKAIEDKYGLPKSQLRIYLHYQPSYYHLHIHFSYLRHEAPGILAERAHLLANVINNIELLPDYYQRVTLPYTIRETDDIFKAFEQSGVLKKVVREIKNNGDEK